MPMKADANTVAFFNASGVVALGDGKTLLF
jgi:hypothetical protein